jgi:hypothetical protein
MPLQIRDSDWLTNCADMVNGALTAGKLGRRDRDAMREGKRTRSRGAFLSRPSFGNASATNKAQSQMIVR